MPHALSSPGDSEIRKGLVLAAIFFCSSAAYAADGNVATVGNFEVTPMFGYRFGGTFEIAGSDGSYKLDDSSSVGLILNLRDRANTQWELFYSKQSTDAKLNSGALLQPLVGIDLQVLQIGGTYQSSGDKLRPYLAATIGGTHIKSDSDSDSFFSGSIGVGLQIMPESRVGIRVEARAYGTLTNSNTNLFCRTGPDQNICAVRVEGKVLGQIETFAGVVFRF